MPCELPMFPNAGHYVSDADHNMNKHKFWFLVLAIGLFTLKSDADPLCAPDNIIIAYIKSQAQRLWDLNCHKRHSHEEDDDDGTAHVISDDDDRVPNVTGPSPLMPVKSEGRVAVERAASVPAKAKRGASAAVKPEPRSPRMLPLYRDNDSDGTSPAVKREGSTAVKRGASATVKTEPCLPRKLPLYCDDSDEGMPSRTLYTAVKREGSAAVKRGASAAVKTEPRLPRKLPLYRDDSDEGMPSRTLYDGASDDDICLEVQPATTPTATGSKHARCLGSHSSLCEPFFMLRAHYHPFEMCLVSCKELQNTCRVPLVKAPVFQVSQPLPPVSLPCSEAEFAERIVDVHSRLAAAKASLQAKELERAEIERQTVERVKILNERRKKQEEVSVLVSPSSLSLSPGSSSD
ncbi:hypothetical protein B0H17DRAFT_1203049 [Mycena rosella]|uniref:Uncharacterized protein n=1 Tax=Mycena rosella TaxID=1033263 RepID=A0AAD7DCT3_MYCRO|nr:hypothetical protein B0H17DRAFT_1203049 [Mycena rosella]